MPAMPRVDNKFTKIAYKILGKPENQTKPVKYAEKPAERDRFGLDDLIDSNRVIPQNYF